MSCGSRKGKVKDLGASVKAEGIRFNYTLTKMDKEGYYEVQGSIENRTDSSLFVLSESCNGLDFCLISKTEGVRVVSPLNCFVSNPIKLQIREGVEMDYNTQLLVEKEVQEVALDLVLITLDYEEEVTRESYDKTSFLKISGPKVSI